MRRRKQQDIDLDLVHGLATGNYDAAYVGGDWFDALKQRNKKGQAVTDEYEEAYIIGFISGDSDHPMNYDEYSQAVARFGKRLQELGKHVSYGEDDEDYDEEESGIRENPRAGHGGAWGEILVPALVRDLLVAEFSIPYDEALRFSQELDRRLTEAKSLTTYRSILFRRD